MDILSALAAWAMFAVAVIAAVFAFRQVREARRLREEDVRIEFDKPLEATIRHQGKLLTESALLTGGIPTMPPGRRITALFDVAHRRVEADPDLTYTATVSFRDFRLAPQEPLTYILDLSHLIDISNVRSYGIHDLAKAAAGIQGILKKWTTRSGLRVHVNDEDAYRYDQQWQFWGTSDIVRSERFVDRLTAACVGSE